MCGTGPLVQFRKRSPYRLAGNDGSLESSTTMGTRADGQGGDDLVRQYKCGLIRQEPRGNALSCVIGSRTSSLALVQQLQHGAEDPTYSQASQCLGRLVGMKQADNTHRMVPTSNSV